MKCTRQAFSVASPTGEFGTVDRAETRMRMVGRQCRSSEGNVRIGGDGFNMRRVDGRLDVRFKRAMWLKDSPLRLTLRLEDRR
jgi:hypothetical protein